MATYAAVDNVYVFVCGVLKSARKTFVCVCVVPQDVDVVIPPALAASVLVGGRGLHLVAFADEEGVRFGSTFLGSRAVVSRWGLGRRGRG